MVCDNCRDAISAQLDGEELPGETVALATHLEGCRTCREFAERAAYVTRLTRTRAAEPAPDLAGAVVSAADELRIPSLRTRFGIGGVRLALGAVGVGQLAVALSGVVGAGTASHHGAMELAGASVAHFANETSAWNLALAVGFLWAATGTSRLAGLVAVVGAFVGVLLALSALDVVAGRVDPGRLVTHVLVVIGLALLLVLQRMTRGDGDAGAVRPPRGRPFVVEGASEPAPERDAGGVGLRPTARHRTA